MKNDIYGVAGAITLIVVVIPSAHAQSKPEPRNIAGVSMFMPYDDVKANLS